MHQKVLNEDQTLFRWNLSILGVFITLLTLHNLPSSGALERLPIFSIDHSLGIFASFLIGAFVLTAVLRRLRLRQSGRHQTTIFKFVGVAATLIILISIATREPFKDYPGLWAGFGFQSAATALALGVTVLAQPVNHSAVVEHKRIRFLIFCALPLLLISPRILLFIQPPNGLINLGDTSYHVIDELLAPLAGGLSYSDYTPQYAGTLGWLIFPIRLLGIDGESTMLLVVVFCNLLTFLVPILVVAISKKVSSRVNRVIVFSAFIALWTVCGSDLGYSSQIREFSQFARFFPALLALWLVLRAVVPGSDTQQRVASYVAGAAVAFACLNSADHGLTFTAAVTTALLVEIQAGRLPWTTITNMFLGFAALAGSYLVALLVSAGGPSLKSYVGLRDSALEGSVYGGDSAPMILGPHLLVLVIPVLLFVVPAPRRETTSYSIDRDPATLVGNTMGSWILLLSAKFFVFPIAPATAALVIPAFLGGVAIFSRITINGFLDGSWSKKLGLLPAVLLLTTASGAVFPTSNVNTLDELKRISGNFVNRNDWSSTPGRPVDGYSLAALRKEDNFLNELFVLHRQVDSIDTKVGYFGVFGNTVEILLGIDNVLGIAAPESMRFGINQKMLACVPVTLRAPEVVLVYASEFPCAGYSIDAALSHKPFFVYRRAENADL